MGETTRLLDHGLMDPPDRALRRYAPMLRDTLSSEEGRMEEDVSAKLVACENQAMQEIADTRARLADFLLKAERIVEDGFPLPIAELTARLQDDERLIMAATETVRGEFPLTLSRTVGNDPDRAKLARSALKRFDRIAGDLAAEYRAAKTRLDRLAERQNRSAGTESRLQRAIALYGAALRATLDHADIKGADLALVDGYAVYRLVVRIAPALYRNARTLAMLEDRAHDLVEQEAPDLVGALALTFEPLGGAA